MIDTVVVSPKFVDFFIVPCEDPPDGSSWPTRYIVVHDGMNWTSDDLQIVSHQLCTWQGPIEVPSMVIFARRMAHLSINNGNPHAAVCDNLP